MLHNLRGGIVLKVSSDAQAETYLDFLYCTGNHFSDQGSNILSILSRALFIFELE